MNLTLVVTAFVLAVLASAASFFWGKKTQRRKDMDVYTAQLEQLHYAEKQAKDRISKELHKLELKRKDFDNLPWDRRIKLLGFNDDLGEPS